MKLDLKVIVNIFYYLKVPPRTSPHMTAQVSLDAQLESGNSPFADFTQFPDSDVSVLVTIFVTLVVIYSSNMLISLRYFNRQLEISHNRWKTMMVCNCQQNHRFRRFNHHKDLVHLKYIASQHHANQHLHPIHWSQRTANVQLSNRIHA